MRQFIIKSIRVMVKYIENYVLYESIGSGVYGKVYRAINNNDKKEYAIKVIPISKFKENKKLQECTVNEINILSNIESHPNIIKYYDMLKTTNNFYFIYEYCNGGTLQNLLAKQVKLAEQNVLLIFKQLLEAFQILNKYNIMHRDMKPDNIFFHNGVIKLGDFGFCKNLNSADQMTKTMLGSPIYMAPEVLKGEIYSNKADIWSLGVVLFEMIFGMCPFQSNSIANLIQVLNSKELQFPGPISPFIKNLIVRMLTKDPIRRISWMQIFQIKINNQGQIQSEKITHTINSLSQAKILDEGQNTLLSIKNLNKVQSDQPSRDFKKNRNVSSNNPIGTVNNNNGNPISNTSINNTNINNINNNNINNNNINNNNINNNNINNNNINNNNINNNNMNSNSNINHNNMNPNNMNPNNMNSNPINNVPNMGSMPSINYIHNNGTNQQSIPINNINPNMIAPTNNKIINQMYINEGQIPQKPGSSYNKEPKVSQEHKLVLEGVRIAMEIIDIKLPNHMGYAHLILTRCLTILGELCSAKSKKQMVQLLEKEVKEIQLQRQSINSKMFAYELKGLQDWKKYLRGKFFQQESTIIYWFKMVTFLNGNYGSHNVNLNSAADIVKQILY